MDAHTIDPVIPPRVRGPLAASLFAHVATLIALALAPHDRLDDEGLDDPTRKFFLELEERRARPDVTIVPPSLALDPVGASVAELAEAANSPATPSRTKSAFQRRAAGSKVAVTRHRLDELARQIGERAFGPIEALESSSCWVLDPNGEPWGDWGIRWNDGTPREDELATDEAAGSQLGLLAGFPNDVLRLAPGPTQGAPCMCGAGKPTALPGPEAFVDEVAKPGAALDATKTNAGAGASAKSPADAQATGNANWERIASSSLGALRGCFARTSTPPQAAERALLRFVIDRQGVVESVTVSGIDDRSLGDCLSRAFAQLSFPSSREKVIGTYAVSARSGVLGLPGRYASGGGGAGATCVCP